MVVFVGGSLCYAARYGWGTSVDGQTQRSFIAAVCWRLAVDYCHGGQPLWVFDRLSLYTAFVGYQYARVVVGVHCLHGNLR
ncbi:hypothetical protein D3C75_1195520 [compost metagenome]